MSPLWPCLFSRHLPKEDGQILEECQGCIGITDDITVYGHTEAEHDACLQNLMHVTHKYGLVFKPKKNM